MCTWPRSPAKPIKIETQNGDLLSQQTNNRSKHKFNLALGESDFFQKQFNQILSENWKLKCCKPQIAWKANGSISLVTNNCLELG